MNRTLLDERFRGGPVGRYVGIDKVHRDLAVFMEHYNLARSHQSYRLKGRTPTQALREVFCRAELPSRALRADESAEEENLPATETAD